jgi:large-conductance mechanosensitive channel
MSSIDSDVLTESISSAYTVFASTFGDFTNFLLEKKVIDLGLAFIISTNINRIASDFVENIISPIINRFVSTDKNKLKDATINIFGIKFEIGNFFNSLLKFVIMMFVIYYIYKIFKKKEMS